MESLYRRYATEVHRFAFFLCGDAAQADDLTSETFVRIWAGTDRIRAETAKAYLLAITRNLHRQRLRHSNRQEPLDPELPDPAQQPDESAATQHELQRVLRMLRKLPEADRAALLLRAEHELPYEELSRILGISAGAARVKVHRARARLAEYRARGERS